MELKSMTNRRSYSGKDNPNWRHGKALCNNCGEELSEYKYKLCRKCYEENKAVNISKEQLEELYINQKLSMNKIGEALCCSGATIHNRLHEYNIMTRSKTEGYGDKGNPNYKGLIKLCVDCGKNINPYNKILRCWSCWVKSVKNENFCIDCGKKIALRSKKCDSCVRKIHKQDCQCCICKGKRGEYNGKNNPNYDNHKIAGENNYNWKGGKSFEPYPLGWTNTFKEQIRYRDGYKCQVCGEPEIEAGRKLDVHHIDYDKDNLDTDNLITLCNSCHTRTNGNREYWLTYFKGVNV